MSKRKSEDTISFNRNELIKAVKTMNESDDSAQNKQELNSKNVSKQGKKQNNEDYSKESGTDYESNNLSVGILLILLIVFFIIAAVVIHKNSDNVLQIDQQTAFIIVEDEF